jgi:PLP dependent protein
MPHYIKCIKSLLLTDRNPAMSASLVQKLADFAQTIPPTVRIIAVTKTQPIAAIVDAYAAGIRDIGESRIQEAQEKQAELADRTPDLTWHLIGRLQTNKARKALEIFDWIHSIDSLKLAQTLDRIASENGRPTPQLCLQVKLQADPQKTGWTIDELMADLPTLDQLAHVQIRGLMVIPPLGSDVAALFAAAQALQTQLQSQSWQRLQLDQLSMGMSGDYKEAIAAGATMIRPGSILFGDRARSGALEMPQ